MNKAIRLSAINTRAMSAFNSEDDAKAKLNADIKKLSVLQEKLFAEARRSVLVIFQGMDTSGKDSMVKHVMSGVNPQGCTVHSFKSPTSTEKSYDYLRRCTLALPEFGKIGIFNRSYYEDVTIARVHHTHALRFWKKRFDEINNFEAYLANNGYVIIKFFLHISKEEQRQRLLKRIADETKHWKFDLSDIREREYWDKYQEYYEIAINHTNTSVAPWTVVPADFKWSARLKVADVIVDALEQMKLTFPKLSALGETQLRKARKSLTHD